MTSIRYLAMHAKYGRERSTLSDPSPEERLREMKRPSSTTEASSVTSEPVYLRFEHRIPPHKKFYEVEVELRLFYPKTLTRRWGRIGGRRPRSLRMVIETPEELRRQVARITRRRVHHGYQVVADVRTPMSGGVAA
jgi:predicted DNA-binding WGR domain protein